jgi:hypothetical protein
MRCSWLVYPTALIFVTGFAIAAEPIASTPRNLLAGPRSLEWVQSHLVAADTFHPYPSADDRAAWTGLPEKIRDSYVALGVEELNAKWEPLTATLLMEFTRTGNRSHFSAAARQRRRALQALTLAECIEDNGRFLDQIGNGIWAISEETFWGIPAHLAPQKAGHGLPDVQEPIIELFSAETGAQLSWTLYLLGERLDKFSPLLRKRIVVEIDRRILTPFLTRDDFWWMGNDPTKHLNNWTPWIVSNVLTCALLVEKDPARRAALVHKALRVLDHFINQYPADGGCDEGPGYWNANGGALFQCLELLQHATNGQFDIYREPLIRDIGRYVYRAHIADEWKVNYGDASGRGRVDGALVYRYGRAIEDEAMAGFGAWALQKTADEAGMESLGRLLPARFATRVADDVKPQEPLVRDAWLPDLQLMIARDQADSAKGLFLAVHGGHNAESHNHNDVGSCIVAVDGRPVLIDVGVETYTRKTFSPQRYDIWTMQSAYHNLPTINGVMQSAGREYAARDVTYRSDDASAEISLDLAAAYPKDAGVERWQRRFRFVRGQEIELTETYSLHASKAPLVLNFMTACDVDLSTPGRVILAGGQNAAAEGNRGLTITFDPAVLRATVETVQIEDGRIKSVWGDHVNRIQLVVEKPTTAGSLVLHLRPNR